MKKKVLFLIIVVFIIFIFSFIIYKYNMGVHSKNNTKKSSTFSLGSVTSNVTKKIKEVNEKEDEKESKKDITKKEEEISSIEQEKVNNNNTAEYKEETNNDNYYENNNQNNTVYEEPIYKNPEPSVNERHVWDDLGISEYDYYNSPMSSWQTVDFRVSDYGSMDTAREACTSYGLNYGPYINGEESFNCDIVTSYSGNYLGYMFYTMKTN